MDSSPRRKGGKQMFAGILVRLVAGLLVLPMVCGFKSMPFQLIGLSLRDYQDNHPATDLDWFYRNTDYTTQSPEVGDGVYNDLEWDIGRAWQIPAAVYTRGSNIAIDLTFVNPGFVSRGVSLIVNDARIAIPPVPPSTSWTYVYLSDDGPHSMSLAPFGGTDTVTLTFSNLPNYVTRAYLQVDMEAQEAGYPIWSSQGWATWEKIYLTDSSPTGFQATVWTDLLEWSCTWAHGYSGGTDVSRELTMGFFWRSPYVYNMGLNPAVYWNESTSVFNLKRALQGTHLNIDCRDVSGLLQLSMQSQGLSSSLRRVKNGDEPTTGGFETNLVCPMGSDANFPGDLYYSQAQFGFHQVAQYSSGIYDAAIAQRVDLSGSGYRNPPYAWSENGYWQTPFSTWYVGLTEGPASPNVTAAVTKDGDNAAISDIK